MHPQRTFGRVDQACNCFLCSIDIAVVIAHHYTVGFFHSSFPCICFLSFSFVSLLTSYSFVFLQCVHFCILSPLAWCPTCCRCCPAFLWRPLPPLLFSFNLPLDLDRCLCLAVPRPPLSWAWISLNWRRKNSCRPREVGEFVGPLLYLSNRRPTFPVFSSNNMLSFIFLAVSSLRSSPATHARQLRTQNSVVSSTIYPSSLSGSAAAISIAVTDDDYHEQDIETASAFTATSRRSGRPGGGAGSNSNFQRGTSFVLPTKTLLMPNTNGDMQVGIL